MQEKLGKIVVTLKEGINKVVLEFQVPSGYPMQPVKLSFKESNFDVVLSEKFEAQAKAVIRRLWQGREAGYDEAFDVNTGKIGFKKSVGGVQADIEKMAVATRSELKHDMDFLKQQAELRHGEMKKVDRKHFKLNIKHEKQYEEAMALKQEKAQQMQTQLDERGQINRVSAKP